MPRYTSVSVKPDTKARLDTFGKKGETYDDLLNRVMDAAAKGGMVA